MAISFEQWKRQVNVALILKCGLGCDDIDDWIYRDDYDNGVSPKRSAARAYRNAKANYGLGRD